MIRRTPYTACPLCGSSGWSKLKEADCTRHALWRPGYPPTITWQRCNGCAHVFTDGYFEGASERQLFADAQESQRPGYDLERQRCVAADMIDRVIRDSGISSGTWLDVGCGAGNLLATAEEYGFRAAGTDVRESTVGTLKAAGFEVFLGTLELQGGIAEVVSLCDVVEHTPFPRETLKQARRVIRECGALLVSMPNAGSFAWAALDKADRNPFWGELEHYHNFTRESLYELLAESGFRPRSYGVSRRYRLCMEVVATAI